MAGAGDQRGAGSAGIAAASSAAPEAGTSTSRAPQSSRVGTRMRASSAACSPTEQLAGGAQEGQRRARGDVGRDGQGGGQRQAQERPGDRQGVAEQPGGRRVRTGRRDQDEPLDPRRGARAATPAHARAPSE